LPRAHRAALPEGHDASPGRGHPVSGRLPGDPPGLAGQRPDGGLVSDEAGLAAAGLNPDEVAAYELIITRPSSTMPELAKAWSRPAPVAAVVARLQARGFVTREDGPQRRYAAVDPEIALDTPLADYEGQLRRAREHVAQLAHQHRSRSQDGDRATLVEVVT